MTRLADGSHDPHPAAPRHLSSPGWGGAGGDAGATFAPLLALLPVAAAVVAVPTASGGDGPGAGATVIFANAAFGELLCAGGALPPAGAGLCAALSAGGADDAAAALAAALGPALAAGGGKLEAQCWRAGGGGAWWNEVTVSPVAGGGAAAGAALFLTLHRDVTAAREDAARGSALEAAVAHLSEGVTIADATAPDRPLIYVNEAFCRMTGYSREEALGRNCRFLQGAETDAREVARIRRAVERGQPVQATIANYRKNGERFWSHLSIAPLPGAPGAAPDAPATRLVGVQMDVTELIQRRHVEQALWEAKVRRRAAAPPRPPRAAPLRRWAPLGAAPRRRAAAPLCLPPPS